MTTDRTEIISPGCFGGWTRWHRSVVRSQPLPGPCPPQAPSPNLQEFSSPELATGLACQHLGPLSVQQLRAFAVWQPLPQCLRPCLLLPSSEGTKPPSLLHEPSLVHPSLTTVQLNSHQNLWDSRTGFREACEKVKRALSLNLLFPSTCLEEAPQKFMTCTVRWY